MKEKRLIFKIFFVIMFASVFVLFSKVNAEQAVGNLAVRYVGYDTRQGIADCIIKIVATDGSGTQLVRQMDSTGTATFENIPVGEYEIKTLYVPDQYAYPLGAKVTIYEDSFYRLEEVLQARADDPAYNINLSFYDSYTNQKIPNVAFAICELDGTMIFGGVTDSEGNCDTKDVLILYKNYEVYIFQMDNYELYDVSEKPFSIYFNDMADVKVEVNRKGGIGKNTVLVQDSYTKECIPNVAFVVRDMESNIVFQGRTDINGQCVVELPYGVYSACLTDYPEEYNNGNIYFGLSTSGQTSTTTVQLDKVASAGDKLLKGDLNKDGKVNSTDAALILDLFQTNTATSEQFLIGDMNNDGKINSTDAAIALDYFQQNIKEYVSK